VRSVAARFPSLCSRSRGCGGKSETSGAARRLRVEVNIPRSGFERGRRRNHGRVNDRGWPRLRVVALDTSALRASSRSGRNFASMTPETRSDDSMRRFEPSDARRVNCWEIRENHTRGRLVLASRVSTRDEWNAAIGERREGMARSRDFSASCRVTLIRKDSSVLSMYRRLLI